jgi:hypothetical protein
MEFLVAYTTRSHGNVSLKEKIENSVIQEYLDDPPNVQCCPSGPTMGSIGLKVERFYKQNKSYKLKRMKKYEVDIKPHWW